MTEKMTKYLNEILDIFFDTNPTKEEIETVWQQMSYLNDHCKTNIVKFGLLYVMGRLGEIP